jgi:hypothetical protein
MEMDETEIYRKPRKVPNLSASNFTRWLTSKNVHPWR